jgi:hypothetical protein
MRRFSAIWIVASTLALGALACITYYPQGDLPSDGTPIEFFGTDEDGEYIWSSQVEPDQIYKVTATYKDQPMAGIWIVVCDTYYDNLGSACTDELARDSDISGEPSLTFTAPDDGDVMIVVSGPSLGGSSEVPDWKIVLTPIEE